MYNYGRESWQFTYASCISQCETERSKVRLPKRYVQSVLQIDTILHTAKGKRIKMAKFDLSKYGITGTTEVVYNPSYELLFEEETKPELEGEEKRSGQRTGRVNVMTGIYTGRSPKDKYNVMDENPGKTLWRVDLSNTKTTNHPSWPEEA